LTLSLLLLTGKVLLTTGLLQGLLHRGRLACMAC
jgi:hypothetical protein